MKRKKILACILTAIMAIGMSITAFASDTVTITVTPPTGTSEAGESYTAYKIFDVVKSEGVDATNDNTTNRGFAYTLASNSPWLSVVQGLKNSQNVNYFTVTRSAEGSTYAVELNSNMTMSEDLAKEIAGKLLAAKPNGVTGTTINSGQSANVDPGYYLITSTLGTNLILATTNIDLQEKNDYPSIDKSIASTDEVVQIGQDVTFTLTMTIPTTADKQIVLTDTMSEGLTFKAISSVVNSHGTNVANTVSAVNPTTNSFTITFPADVVAANKGETITVTYVATVNEKAVVSAVNDSNNNGGDRDDNTNEIRIDYSGFTQTDKVDVNTLSFQLDKYDGAETGGTHTPIAGATFQLLDANKAVMKLYKVSATEYRIPTAAEIAAKTNIVESFTTVAGQNITFKGVDNDRKYYLRETEAPAGYNKLANDTEAQPADDLSLVVEIANNKGSELPSTGGIGTTLFYLLGSALAVGALVVLISRKVIDVKKD